MWLYLPQGVAPARGLGPMGELNRAARSYLTFALWTSAMSHRDVVLALFFRLVGQGLITGCRRIAERPRAGAAWRGAR